RREGASATGTPQFSLALSDISGGGLVIATNQPELVAAHKQFVEFLRLSSTAATDLQKFSQTHLNQQVQFLIGTNVVAQQTISSVITNNELDLYYPSWAATKVVSDALVKK